MLKEKNKGKEQTYPVGIEKKSNGLPPDIVYSTEVRMITTIVATDKHDNCYNV